MLVGMLGGMLVGACRCGEALEQLEPDIVVEPEVIAFSRARVGKDAHATLQVGNRGSGRLDLAARIEPGDQGFFIDSAPESVRPRLAADLGVRFTPPGRAAFAAELILTSNDPDTPELRVPLTGEGGPPQLTIDPDPVDLGLVNEGPGAARLVTLSNTGYDVLSLESAGLDDGRAFTLDAAALPTALLPGESVGVTVSLAPDASLTPLLDRAGLLQDLLVVTHAEGQGEAVVRAGINLAPVAIAVELVTRRDVVKIGVGRAVVVDGSETVDPEGDSFTFVWSLADRPAGSVAALVGQGQPTTRVTPDAVGRYRVALRAIDVHGAFSDADVEILPRDLGVVLTWSPSGSAACLAFSEAQCAAMSPTERARNCCGQSDLDLHLIRPEGVLGDYGSCPGGCDPLFCGEIDDAHADTCRQTGTDCAFANRAPDWGAPGRIDDPRLDIDDVRGEGPEITSLDEPEDGVYRVLVHYCRDDVGEPSLATVEIFVEGVSVFVTAPEPIAMGEVWTAATLVRSAGAWEVQSSPGLVVVAPAGLCDG